MHRTHQFYSILVKAAFNSRPGLIPFFTSRMVELTLQHGFCVHSIHALVTFSATYCVNNLVANVKEASKIGKMAIATLNKRFSSSPEVAQVSRRMIASFRFGLPSSSSRCLLQIYHVYFAFVSPFVDPLQFVMDNLARGESPRFTFSSLCSSEVVPLTPLAKGSRPASHQETRAMPSST